MNHGMLGSFFANGKSENLIQTQNSLPSFIQAKKLIKNDKDFHRSYFFAFNFSSVAYLKLRVQFPNKVFDSHKRKKEYATIILHCERQTRQKKEKKKKKQSRKEINKNVNINFRMFLNVVFKK